MATQPTMSIEIRIKPEVDVSGIREALRALEQAFPQHAEEPSAAPSLLYADQPYSPSGQVRTVSSVYALRCRGHAPDCECRLYDGALLELTFEAQSIEDVHTILYKRKWSKWMDYGWVCAPCTRHMVSNGLGNPLEPA